MKCEELREQLPDYTLGTLPDLDAAAIRRHLRGCSGCRAEAATLDEGVGLFASAAHDTPPPPELKQRVMTVLAEEWVEAPAPKRSPSRFLLRWQSMAAVLILLAGALVWGGAAQVHANRASADAATYRTFLHTLGGKDVRVGVLSAQTRAVVEGSVVMYDSEKGQSWVLVLIRAPGYTGQMTASALGPGGQAITLRPIQIDPDGEGSTWLVTGADVSRFRTVRISASDGTVLAVGSAAPED